MQLAMKSGVDTTWTPFWTPQIVRLVHDTHLNSIGQFNF